jgi:HEAT repeat protein
MLLKDPKVSDRANALLILCRSKNLESQNLLRKALQDDDWSVRAMAAQMIAHTAQTDLLDSLPPLFKDDNHKVRFRAAGAYLHLLPMAR